MALALKIPQALLAPWAITEEGLRLVANASWDGDYADTNGDADIKRSGSVAIIEVQGPLYAHGNGFAGLFESMGMATTYDGIRAKLRSALADSSVKSILLNIDSPGGEANGCGELADEVYAARAQKPIISYVSGMGASGAYWLAAATSKIVCAPSAELGSIGVKMAMLDDSKALEAEGIKVASFVSSQSPFKTTDISKSEDCARVQARVDALAGVFVGAVAKYRGVSDAFVLDHYGKGDVMIGADSVKCGLADEIGALDSTLSQMKEASSMKTIMSALGLSANATEAEAYAAVASMKDAGSKLCALTGKASAEESIAVVAAWKESAAQVNALKEQAAKAEAARVDAEFASILDAACKDGKIPPAPDAKQRVFAESLRGTPKAIDTLRAYVEALPAVVVTASAPAILEPKPADGAVVLSNADKAMAKKMGITEAKYAETKMRRAKIQSEQPEADDAA